MRMCSESNAAVVPAGRMSWLECGNPLRSVDVVLSLERMQRIIDYSPADLTATVEAGVTLGAFNAVTAQQRQWLPLDPPGFRSASLGAIVGCNSSGALRLGFGTPRDYVVGLRLVHADGLESRSGGKVVKNVAGYDLCKLYTGSLGTLGVITPVTLKVRPRPEALALLMTDCRWESIGELLDKLHGSATRPVCIDILHGAHDEPPSIFVGFEDNAQAVAWQVERLRAELGTTWTVNSSLTPKGGHATFRFENTRDHATLILNTGQLRDLVTEMADALAWLETMEARAATL